MYYAGVSLATRNDMRANLWRVPDEQILTLYNCIDLELTEPQFLSRAAARKAFSLSASDKIIGTLGRLVPDKDQKTLISAFSV